MCLISERPKQLRTEDEILKGRVLVYKHVGRTEDVICNGLLTLPPAETRTLPRSSSMAAGLERNGRTRVQAVFSHAAGDNSTLLSFSENDVITLLVPEARDGWHYGENEKTRM